ncbi:PREDICTED: vegetative cell wall protein gp1-like [Bison bison bison]|uniref:Vegetative cell wall protein gp1-like n=1 Tax=Bison bison bison TaxID=43346 RepID=A0A6P3JDV9_BISBB|nr:PREDICTED: vegetative cell wall protein gp1-like [Bison bison bison]
MPPGLASRAAQGSGVGFPRAPARLGRDREGEGWLQGLCADSLPPSGRSGKPAFRRRRGGHGYAKGAGARGAALQVSWAPDAPHPLRGLANAPCPPEPAPSSPALHLPAPGPRPARGPPPHLPAPGWRARPPYNRSLFAPPAQSLVALSPRRDSGRTSRLSPPPPYPGPP